MQLVADRWYRLYNWIALAVGVVFVAFSAMAEAGSLSANEASKYGLSRLTLVLGAVLCIYSLVGFRLTEKRAGSGPAALVSAMFVTTLLLSLLNQTGQAQWVLPLWVVNVALFGMFGALSIISTLFVSTLYVVLFSGAGLARGKIDQTDIIFLASSYLIGIASYFLWKQAYLRRQRSELSALSNMLKSKQVQSEILIESLADGVIVADIDGKIALINPSAAKLSGWKVSEAIGIDARLVFKFVDDKGNEIDQVNHPFTKALQQKSAISQTLQAAARDDTRHYLSVVISPIMVPGSNQFSGIVGVLRDVSSERSEEARRADFISTASHEMRTPVAAIEGYLALALNDKVSTIDSRARGFIDKAHISTQHLGKLFQDLLTSAKAEDGRLTSHPTPVELGEFVEHLTDDLRFAAQKKNLLVEYISGTSASTTTIDATAGSGVKVVRPLYYVLVDPERLREVITNLFDNAVKYTETGKISLGITGDTKVVQLYVQDTGPGIPVADVPHLFQKFYRVDNTATRTIGGTGLGLFICRKIIELYNGRIWVESTVGTGSTFYINLPRLSREKVAQLQTGGAPQAESTPLTTGNNVVQ